MDTRSLETERLILLRELGRIRSSDDDWSWQRSREIQEALADIEAELFRAKVRAARMVH